MDNANLEKLKVSVGRLLPKFKSSVTEYTLTLGSDVGEVKLTPLTSDGGASYAIKASSGKAGCDHTAYSTHGKNTITLCWMGNFITMFTLRGQTAAKL